MHSYNNNYLYCPFDSIPLIGVFFCKVRQKSFHSNNNNYINNQSSIAKQSFRSTVPDTRQPSKRNDGIKMDTLPPIPQNQRTYPPPVQRHGKENEDFMPYEEVQHMYI